MVEKTIFGKTSAGEEVTLYSISNSKGMKVTCCDYGALVVGIYVVCPDGQVRDVALGFDDVAGYEANPPFFGTFIGRVCNRIGGASFTLNGKTYELAKNEYGKNTLHSCEPWYHKVMYKGEVNDDGSVSFMRTSPDLEQGYPGNLDIKVTYKVTEDNELRIIYDAVCDQDTILNFTNHSYFNLDGEDAGSIEKHIVQMRASNFTPTTSEQITTGEICPVAGTPLDFTVAKEVGADIDADFEPLNIGKGYDHNYVIDKDYGAYGLAATCKGENGLTMEVYTDMPGVQFYSGNNIGEVVGKGGRTYHSRDGLCFETQFFPNSCNIEAFPSTVLMANTPFHSETAYKFI